MSEFATVTIGITAAMFILAMTALLLGRKTSFKMQIWKANIEFGASERPTIRPDARR